MHAARRHPMALPAADPWNVFGGGTPSTTGHIRPLSGGRSQPGEPEKRDPTAMRRIGEILVGAGVITVETRDRVLEYQEWNHVSFGTALLESGALPEQLFLRALSVQFSVPAASAAELETIPPEVLALVKSRVADRSSVVPLRKVGRTLHLAMARPNDRVAIRSVSLLTGLTVVPHVAIAFRLALAIEKHYGIPAASHFRAVAEALDAKARTARDSQPARPAPPAALPWRSLTRALAQARNPDELAAALLDFLGEVAGPSALYLGRRDEAVLWRTRPAANASVGASVPYVAGSLFASLRGPNDVFAGPCPDTEANRRILASVGGAVPADLLVVPVRLNGRTVLYLVSRPARGAQPLDEAALRRLARIGATALGLVALHERLRSV